MFPPPWELRICFSNTNEKDSFVLSNAGKESRQRKSKPRKVVHENHNCTQRVRISHATSHKWTLSGPDVPQRRQGANPRVRLTWNLNSHDFRPTSSILAINALHPVTYLPSFMSLFTKRSVLNLNLYLPLRGFWKRWKEKRTQFV